MLQKGTEELNLITFQSVSPYSCNDLHQQEDTPSTSSFSALRGRSCPSYLPEIDRIFGDCKLGHRKIIIFCYLLAHS